MSFVLVVPHQIQLAASNLAGVGSLVETARAASAVSTTAIVPAAADEVSESIASLFSVQAREFQAISAKAEQFHADLVQRLTSAAGIYETTEVGSAAAMAAAKGDPLRALGRVITEAAKKLVPGAITDAARRLDALTPDHTSLLDRIPKIPIDREQTPWAIERRARNAAFAQRAAANAKRIEAILNNGVQLIARDGTAVYTDGQAFVKHFRPMANGPLVPSLLEIRQGISETNQNIIIRNNLKLDVATARSLLGSQLQVVERGAGLAQTYYQTVGNALYQVRTDVAGRVLQTLRLR